MNILMVSHAYHKHDKFSHGLSLDHFNIQGQCRLWIHLLTLHSENAQQQGRMNDEVVDAKRPTVDGRMSNEERVHGPTHRIIRPTTSFNLMDDRSK
jgi:hypothetical protein